MYGYIKIYIKILYSLQYIVNNYLDKDKEERMRLKIKPFFSRQI